MAALMRGVICLVSIERNAFLSKRMGFVEESKRYIRGLRRKPVQVLFPENETGKVAKPPPESHQAAKQHVKKQRDTEVTSALDHAEQSGPVKTRRDVQSTVKHPQVTFTKDQVDGLRFEKAVPGDKRLA